ncbi:MAG TPA: hypothetical protein VMG74_03595 [Gaiellaceae bacterium]|nr:hypothetical protein [Gaiellaceae bacterium]HUJ56290.1 hypothetical protein [Gaiellaceae bacterium]
MRIARSMLLALVGLLVAAVVAQSAGAIGPTRPLPVRTQPAPTPAGPVVVMTASRLGAAYPWVQPLFRGGLVRGTIVTRTERNADVQPIFVWRHGFVVPVLP